MAPERDVLLDPPRSWLSQPHAVENVLGELNDVYGF